MEEKGPFFFLAHWPFFQLWPLFKHQHTTSTELAAEIHIKPSVERGPQWLLLSARAAAWGGHVMASRALTPSERTGWFGLNIPETLVQNSSNLFKLFSRNPKLYLCLLLSIITYDITVLRCTDLSHKTQVGYSSDIQGALTVLTLWNKM